MPARKTKEIKKAIMEHVDGNRKAISQYRIHNLSKHVESFTLVIIPNPKPAKPNLTDQYLVFATNIAKGKILFNISQIPKEYKNRLGN